MNARGMLDQFLGTTDAEFRAWLRAILANNIALVGRRIGPMVGGARSLEGELDQSAPVLEQILACDRSE